jgi:hypothetical protein
MSHIPCHSERSEESLINLIGRHSIGFERCFASLNMTEALVRFFS